MSSWCEIPEMKQIIEVIFVTFLEVKLNLIITFFYFNIVVLKAAYILLCICLVL